MNRVQRFGQFVCFLWVIIYSFGLNAYATETTLAGHFATITSLAFTPDGDRLISGDADGVLKIWDVAQGKCLASFPAHQGRVHDIKVSENGKGFATAGADNAVKVWSVATFACLRSFSPVGQKKTMIEEMLETTDLRTKPGAYAIDFSGSTQYLGSGHGDCSAVFWDIKTSNFTVFAGSMADKTSGKAPSRPVLSVAVSSDAQMIAAGEEQTVFTDVLGKTSVWASIYIWNPFSGEQLKNISTKGSVIFLDFIPGSRNLISGISNGKLILWDAVQGQAIKTFHHGSTLDSADLSLSGKLLASCSRDQVKVWDMQTGAVKTFQGTVGASFTSVALSGNDALLAVGNERHTISIFRVEQLQEQVWQENNQPIAPHGANDAAIDAILD